MQRRLYCLCWFAAALVSVVQSLQLNLTNRRHLSNSLSFRRRSRTHPYSQKSWRINVVDPSSVDTLTNVVTDPQTTQAFIDGFVGTLSARFFGTLFANVLAGFLIKFLTDSFFNRMGSDEQRDSSKKGYSNNESNSNDFNNNNRNQQQLAKRNESEKKKLDIPGDAWFYLIVCIAIDLIGDSSFLLPGVGEIEDAVWAPLSAYILSNVFGSNIITGLDFLKELLPGTDFIPIASLAWSLKYIWPDSPLAKTLGVGTVNNTLGVGNDDKNKS